MGAGASAAHDAIKEASAEDLKGTLAGLSTEDRSKVEKAVADVVAPALVAPKGAPAAQTPEEVIVDAAGAKAVPSPPEPPSAPQPPSAPKPDEEAVAEAKAAATWDDGMEAQCKAIFEELDTNKSGYIDKREIRAAVGKFDIALALDDEMLANLIKEVDGDGDGGINYSEFRKVAAGVLGVSIPSGFSSWGDREEAQCKAVFDEIDTNSSGTIRSSELRSAFEKLGVSVSDFELRAAMEAADKDYNGEVTYHEFRNWVQKAQGYGPA